MTLLNFLFHMLMCVFLMFCAFGVLCTIAEAIREFINYKNSKKQ